jgi:hypothetical protein
VFPLRTDRDVSVFVCGDRLVNEAHGIEIYRGGDLVNTLEKGDVLDARILGFDNDSHPIF